MNKINIPHKLRILNSNEEVANELLKIIHENNFSKVVLITTKTPNYLITNELEVFLFDKVQKLKTFQVINASVSYANALPITDFDLVIGVGGGKVIDSAKYAAHINKIPVISIPTTISNDGICSPVAVLKEKENKYKSLGATIPIALLVPLHLIEKSDEESIISGIGDLLSNLSAAEDCRLALTENNEKIDDYAVILAEQAARNIFSEIKNYILQGKSKEKFLKENLKEIINSLTLSGIAMEIAKSSRPASGAEHLVSHAMDELHGGLRQHGLQVAFGMYLMSFLRSKLGYIRESAFDEIRAVLRFIGLPTTISSFGLSKEKLIEIIQHAPKTRPERFTILNKMNMDRDYLSEVIDKLFGVKVTVYT